jgi:hypothetical protein
VALAISGFTGWYFLLELGFAANCLNQDIQDLRIYRMVFFVGVRVYRKLSESGYSGFEDLQDGIFCWS